MPLALNPNLKDTTRFLLWTRPFLLRVVADEVGDEARTAEGSSQTGFLGWFRRVSTRVKFGLLQRFLSRVSLRVL